MHNLARIVATCVGVAVLAGGSTAEAQCAVCGNPAFSVGDNDVLRSFQLPRLPAKGTVVRAQVRVTQLNFNDLADENGLVSPEKKGGYVFTRDWALQPNIVTVAVDVLTGFGTGLSLHVPMAQVAATRYPDDGESETKDVDGNPVATTTDSGLSDIEVRARQHLTGPRGTWAKGGPVVVLSAGWVAASGKFIPKDSSGAVPDGYASVGRGVQWGLLELEATDRIGRLAWRAGFAGRHALTHIDHKGFLFHWGSELRAHGSAMYEMLANRVWLGLGLSHQVRGQGKERIFENLPLDPFPNGGGQFLDLQPSVAVQLPAGLELSAAMRLPLWRTVNGVQPVPGLGWTIGLGWLGTVGG